MIHPVIPHLSPDIAYLRTMSDQIVYLIRHFIFNPGRTFSFSEEESASLRGLIGEFGYTPESMKTSTKRVLENLMSHYFPLEAIEVSVEIKDENISDYTLVITIAADDHTGQPLLKSSMIKIGVDNSFTALFNGETI